MTRLLNWSAIRTFPGRLKSHGRMMPFAETATVEIARRVISAKARPFPVKHFKFMNLVFITFLSRLGVDQLFAESRTPEA